MTTTAPTSTRLPDVSLRQLCRDVAADRQWDAVPSWSPWSPGQAGSAGPWVGVLAVGSHDHDIPLGVGGLLAAADAAGVPVRREVLPARVTSADTADAALDAVLADAVETLAQGADPARVLLVAPWRFDGDDEHEALGEAAARAADHAGAALVQYPLSLWEWGDLYQLPRRDLVRVAVDEPTIEAKVAALLELDGTSVRPIDLDGALMRVTRGSELLIAAPAVAGGAAR